MRQVLFFAVAAMALAIAASLALGGVPHVPDEASYLLQARLFADGLRVGPAGAAADLMDWPLWQHDPAASVFPIGWSLLLAPWAALGLEQLANPLLAGLLPILGYLALKERLEEREARFAALALAVMPGVSALAGSLMAHTSVFAALLGALAVGLRGRDGPGWSLMAGMGLGYVVLARPFDATLMAGPLALWMAWRRPRMAWTLAPVLVAGALVLADNAWMTGSPTRFLSSVELELDQPGCNRLGFGEDVGCNGEGYTPADAMRNGLISLERMERLILGLPGGGLAVLAGAALGRRRLLFTLPWLVVPVLGYALYWSPGAAYGARFYHPGQLAIAACVGVVLARWRVAPLLFGVAVLVGQGLVFQDLSRSYFCADPAVAEATKGLSGTVFLQTRGERTSWHPTLRLQMVCGPHMGHSPILAAHDPSGDGLQVLRMPTDESRWKTLLEQLPAPIWVVDHQVDQQDVDVFQVK